MKKRPGLSHLKKFKKTSRYIAGTLVQWLWEETDNWEVVSSNPGTEY